MMRHVFSRGFQVLVLFAAASASSQGTPYDTTVPNQFAFADAQYFATRGGTNASITIHFWPGNSSWSGSVNFATRDGSAIANQDYLPASGTLYFSGNPYASFNVPLLAGATNTQKTIALILWANNPGDVITRSNAVLTINLPPPPNLGINPQSNGSVLLWWPDDGTNPMLEKFVPGRGTNWNVIYQAPQGANGFRWCFDSTSEPMAFYRLHRAQ